VIHPAPNEFWIVGYRCRVSIDSELARWPALKQLHVESGHWDGDQWKMEGECWYVINQSTNSIGLNLDVPQAVRVYW